MNAITSRTQMLKAVKDIRESKLPFQALKLIIEDLDFDYDQYISGLNAELQDLRNKIRIITITCEKSRLGNKEKLEFIHEIATQEEIT